MIRLMTGAQRVEYPDLFDHMFRDRKRVFVDGLGWQLPMADAVREIDQFDTDGAVYLAAVGGDGDRHLGSVRLLPTTQPHLLDQVFPALCSDGTPTGSSIWEASRLCASPDLRDSRTILGVHRRLALAMIEFALMHQIDAYTCVTESRHVAALLSTGWRVDPLSLPTLCDGSLIEALAIRIEPSTLHRVRTRSGIATAVIDFTTPVMAAAA